MRRRFDRVVTLPTDDRVVGVPRCCWRATASRYRRWASAYRVPKASDDLPDPDTPVNTTRASRGMSTSTPFRLWVRAPRTDTNPVNRGPAAGRVVGVVPM